MSGQYGWLQALIKNNPLNAKWQHCEKQKGHRCKKLITWIKCCDCDLWDIFQNFYIFNKSLQRNEIQILLLANKIATLHDKMLLWKQKIKEKLAHTACFSVLTSFLIEKSVQDLFTQIIHKVVIMSTGTSCRYLHLRMASPLKEIADTRDYLCFEKSQNIASPVAVLESMRRTQLLEPEVSRPSKHICYCFVIIIDIKNFKRFQLL